VDYARGTASPYFSYSARLPIGNVTLGRCIFLPNSGLALGSRQVTVAVHAGAAYQLEWRPPGSDHFRRAWIPHGGLHINRADSPIPKRWVAAAKVRVIALERRFVDRIADEAFSGDAGELRTEIGIRDPIIERLGALCNIELAEHGAGGRLYVEGLATTLIVHLFRRYGIRGKPLQIHRGGLAGYVRRRVLDYIENHLGDDIGLADLASVADLGTHHFGQAFRASMGIAPYRYVIERRVERAKELLKDRDIPIAAIAMKAGFSNQSHLTVNFRKVTGVTPARYRRLFE
jgi:AraC family transcriptional regulator